MKSFFAVILLFSTLTLAACGFRPMYGDRAIAASPSVQSALNAIEIANIPDRSGLYLRNQLIDRFYKSGAPADPLYRLTLNRIEEVRTGLDVTIDEESTRAQLRLSTALTLNRADTGEAVLTRPLYALVSYNILESQFTTRVAEDNARLNGLNDLARQIEQAIVLKLAEDPK
jgi:LPS-assembly lipoprotein